MLTNTLSRKLVKPASELPKTAKERTLAQAFLILRLPALATGRIGKEARGQTTTSNHIERGIIWQS